jgi:hypothetical protein
MCLAVVGCGSNKATMPDKPSAAPTGEKPVQQQKKPPALPD